MSEVNPIFGDRGQLDYIAAYLIPGETLHAVFDRKEGSPSFVGITDQRILFYDQDALFKHKAMISIPYNQVLGVAFADDGAILKTNEITLTTAAGRFSVEFRGIDKARWTYLFILDQILNGPGSKHADNSEYT